MQNDRSSIVFRPCGNRLMYEGSETTETVRVALGGGMRFTIFPVSESTHVHNLFSMVVHDRFLGKTFFQLAELAGNKDGEPIPRRG